MRRIPKRCLVSPYSRRCRCRWCKFPRRQPGCSCSSPSSCASIYLQIYPIWNTQPNYLRTNYLGRVQTFSGGLDLKLTWRHIWDGTVGFSTFRKSLNARKTISSTPDIPIRGSMPTSTDDKTWNGVVKLSFCKQFCASQAHHRKGPLQWSHETPQCWRLSPQLLASWAYLSTEVSAQHTDKIRSGFVLCTIFYFYLLHSSLHPFLVTLPSVMKETVTVSVWLVIRVAQPTGYLLPSLSFSHPPNLGEYPSNLASRVPSSLL